MKNRALIFLLLLMPACQSEQTTGFLKPYALGKNIIIPYNFPNHDICVNNELPQTSEDPITGLDTEFINNKSLAYHRENSGKWQIHWHEIILAPKGRGHITIPRDPLTSYYIYEIFVQLEYIECTPEKIFTGPSAYIYSARVKI